MSSRIGYIVKLLFKDKYPENELDKLDKKDRLRLQKELSFLKSETHEINIKLNPGIYDLNNNIMDNPIPYEILDLNWSWEKYHEEYLFNAFKCKNGANISLV